MKVAGRRGYSKCNTDTTGGTDIYGIKYHIKSGDDITVKECFEYVVHDKNFIVDDGGLFTIEPMGELRLTDGNIHNCGHIINCGNIII